MAYFSHKTENMLPTGQVDLCSHALTSVHSAHWRPFHHHLCTNIEIKTLKRLAFINFLSFKSNFLVYFSSKPMFPLFLQLLEKMSLIFDFWDSLFGKKFSLWNFASIYLACLMSIVTKQETRHPRYVYVAPIETE